MTQLTQAAPDSAALIQRQRLLDLLALMIFIIFFQAYMVAPDQHRSNDHIVNAGRSSASRKGLPLSITFARTDVAPIPTLLQSTTAFIISARLLLAG